MFGRIKKMEQKIMEMDNKYKLLDSILGIREKQIAEQNGRINRLLEHLKLYEHTEPAQPEKKTLKKGKKPEPKYELYGGSAIAAQQAAAQQNVAYNRPGVWWDVT